jgi:hypothetical protein
MELNELVNISHSINKVNQILEFTIHISLTKTKYEYLQQQVYIHINKNLVGYKSKKKFQVRFNNVIFQVVKAK